MNEIIQKVNMIMLPKRTKEFLVSFVRGDEKGLIVLQQVLGILVDFFCTHIEIDPHVTHLVSEKSSHISPTNMERIEGTVGITIFSGDLPQRLDHSRCRTLYLIGISQVVSHKSLSRKNQTLLFYRMLSSINDKLGNSHLDPQIMFPICIAEPLMREHQQRQTINKRCPFFIPSKNR